MVDQIANFAYSQISIPPYPATTGSGFAVMPGGGSSFPKPPFNATIWPLNVQPLSSNAEIVRVTTISGDGFFCIRAQEGTTAKPITAGYQIAQTITSGLLTQLINTSGGIQSISGPGKTESPGLLVQSGGLTVTDFNGDGVNVNTQGNFSVFTPEVVHIDGNSLVEINSSNEVILSAGGSGNIFIGAESGSSGDTVIINGSNFEVSDVDSVTITSLTGVSVNDPTSISLTSSGTITVSGQNLNLYGNGNFSSLVTSVSSISGSLVTTNNNLGTLSGNLATTNSNIATISGVTYTNQTNITTLSGNLSVISGVAYNALPKTGGTISGSLTVSGTFGVANLINLSGTNTAIGINALLSGTDNYNVAIGQNSQKNTSAGGSNTSVGSNNFTTNVSGSNNVVIGAYALKNASQPNSNTVVGASSMFNASGTASNNVAIGYQTLYNTSANNNTVVGANSMVSGTTAANNTFIGQGIGTTITTGGNNVAIGQGSMANASSSASTNISIGYANFISGNPYGAISIGPYTAAATSYTIALGYHAGTGGLAQNGSIMIGFYAGAASTTYGTFIGYNAAASNVSGTNNTFIGYQAGYANVNGSLNTFIGDSAGLNAVTSNNVGICYYALSSASGNNNTAVGMQSQQNSTTGFNNTSVGYQSQNSNIVGFANTSLGYRALYSNVGGSYNTAIGYNVTGVSGLYGTVLIGVDGSGNVPVPTANNQFILGTSTHSVIVPGTLSVSGSITLSNPLSVANGGTGVTTSTGSGSSVLNTNPTIVAPFETVPISSTALSGSTAASITLVSGAVFLYTSNPTATWSLNVTGAPTTTGQSATVAIGVVNGATAYLPSNITINTVQAGASSSVLPAQGATNNNITSYYQGGTAWSAADASTLDFYTLTIICTGSSTWTLLLGLTKF